MRNWLPPLSDEELNKIKTVAQLPQVLAAARIRTPTLVIMLGSTPAKAGLELERHLLTLSPRDRRRVALIFIDTDDVPSDVRAFRKVHEGVFQEATLRVSVPAGINFATLPRADQHTYIPSKIPQYFANGAGGIRNNGHVAAAFDHLNIVQTLESALLSIEKLEASRDEERIREIHVNIVAFLGGGTGSGILPDVAVIARQMLIARQYQQRINLFCMLPEPIYGASTIDVSWRKSNATACLLELLAHSLAAGAATGTHQTSDAANGRNGARTGIYEKYLLNHRYYVTDDPIANEIYLVGRTAMSTAEDSARIVGIDLFQRITDASGVGFLEHSTWVNRRVLGATDERGLPTMFGTSCPLEVSFPTLATAKAFAQISAAYLLPALKAAQEPVEQPIMTTDKQGWRGKWREVALLTENDDGKPLAVKKQGVFSPEMFDGATQDTFPVRRRELERRIQATREAIKLKIAHHRNDEERRIFGSNASASDPTSGGGVLGRQLAHALRLQQEYEAIKSELEFNRPDEPSTQALDELEAEYLREPWWMPPSMFESRQHEKAAELADEYNAVMESQAVATRHGFLYQSVQELIKLADQRIAELRDWYQTSDLEKQSSLLETDGRTSAAWRGEMDQIHPHLRHLYDVATLRAQDGRCLAIERLYNYVTFDSTSQRVSGQNSASADFAKRIEETFLTRFLAYLADRTEEDASRASEDHTRDVESEGKHLLAERVVEFFTAHYLAEFEKLNLFDLLERGAGSNRAPLSDYLLEHLRSLQGLMEGLIAFEANLWDGGGERMDRTLYLGVRWEETKSYQKAALDRAIRELGPMTSQNLTPAPANMIDPHRLQISYGQHGISLATIPDYYLDNNSSMQCYLHHQADWFGSDTPIPSMPAPSAYGTNKMPVHASGEMEELICDCSALGYSAHLPHSALYGTNLRGRVIRDPASHRDTPDWGAPRTGTGHPPGGAPRAGRAPSGQSAYATPPDYGSAADAYPRPDGYPPRGYTPPGQAGQDPRARDPYQGEPPYSAHPHDGARPDGSWSARRGPFNEQQ